MAGLVVIMSANATVVDHFAFIARMLHSHS
jgi:hypothetical protein